MNVKVRNANVKFKSKLQTRMNVTLNWFQSPGFGGVEIYSPSPSEIWVQLDSYLSHLSFL
jgi:hypothetical protein